MNNQLKQHEHIFISGMTGSGKSELAKAYSSSFERVTKYDTKGDALKDISENRNPWANVPKEELIIVQNFDDYETAYADNIPYIIYCPNLNELSPEGHENFFQHQYLMQNNTTWVDEVMEVNDSPLSLGYYYKGLLTRGRSRKSNVISCTQRPSGIHQLIMSQSTHYFIMTHNLIQDRKKIAQASGCDEFLTNPPWQSFWYWRQGDTSPSLGKLVL